jgi:hypothetical protein
VFLSKDSPSAHLFGSGFSFLPRADATQSHLTAESRRLLQPVPKAVPPGTVLGSREDAASVSPPYGIAGLLLRRISRRPQFYAGVLFSLRHQFKNFVFGFVVWIRIQQLLPRGDGPIDIHLALPLHDA